MIEVFKLAKNIIGNCPTSKNVQILRDNFDIINQFGDSAVESILVLA